MIRPLRSTATALLGVLVIALAVLATACGGSAAEPERAETVGAPAAQPTLADGVARVDLDPIRPRTRVEVSAGDQFVVAVEENPEVFNWHVEGADRPGGPSLLSSGFALFADDLPEAGGERVWRFAAGAAGESELVFVLVPLDPRLERDTLVLELMVAD